MSKRKTLVDVALAAGVSKMTASRALRGDKDVSQVNRDRVHKAAREIGYSGNHLAASLSSARTDLIGVIVPSLSNIVFPRVMSGVSDALLGSGLQPMFGVTDYDPEREYEAVRSILSWRPAGLIVTGLDQPPDTRRLLAEAEVPIVQIMDCDGEAIDACVGFSHAQAGRQMAEALIAAGRTRFGYVGCNLDKDRRAARRRQGFGSGLTDHGLTEQACACDEALSSVEAGRRLTARLLAGAEALDCIYYSNDDMAVGGLCHCLEAGIDVPGRLALAGFNGLDLLEGFPGRIATSRTARHRIGVEAARLILGALGKPAIGGQHRLILQPDPVLGLLDKGA